MIMRQLVTLTQSTSRDDGAHHAFLPHLPLRFIVVSTYTYAMSSLLLNHSGNALTDTTRWFLIQSDWQLKTINITSWETKFIAEELARKAESIQPSSFPMNWQSLNGIATSWSPECHGLYPLPECHRLYPLPECHGLHPLPGFWYSFFCPRGRQVPRELDSILDCKASLGLPRLVTSGRLPELLLSVTLKMCVH